MTTQPLTSPTDSVYMLNTLLRLRYRERFGRPDATLVAECPTSIDDYLNNLTQADFRKLLVSPVQAFLNEHAPKLEDPDQLHPVEHCCEYVLYCERERLHQEALELR